MEDEIEVVVTVEPDATPVEETDAVDAVLVEHQLSLEQRVSTLEAQVAQLVPVVSEVANVAADAAVTAEAAVDMAASASAEASDAAVTAAAAIEAAEVVAEETPSETDDIIVEQIENDVPVRKPNLWFDDNVRERIRG